MFNKSLKCIESKRLDRYQDTDVDLFLCVCSNVTLGIRNHLTLYIARFQFFFFFAG